MGFNLDFRLLSNGYLIERYDLAVRQRPFEFVISVDGATANFHEQNRKKASFERAKKAVNWLKDRKINTTLQYCINKSNIHQLEEIIKLAEDLNVTALILLGTIRTGENKDLVLDAHQKRKIVDRIRAIKTFIDVYIAPSILISKQEIFCNHIEGLSNLELNPKGEIVYCCNTIRYGAVVGFVKDNTLSDLYKKTYEYSDYLKRIRKKMLQNSYFPDWFDNCDFCSNILKDKIL